MEKGINTVIKNVVQKFIFSSFREKALHNKI